MHLGGWRIATFGLLHVGGPFAGDSGHQARWPVHTVIQYYTVGNGRGVHDRTAAHATMYVCLGPQRTTHSLVSLVARMTPVPWEQMWAPTLWASRRAGTKSSGCFRT